MALNTMTNTAAPATETTAWDLQKQKVQEEEAKRRKEQQLAMKRRLASQGLGAQPGGLAETQSRRLETELAAGEQGRLRDIDIAQLQEQANVAEAEKNRDLTREQLAQQAQLTREGWGFTAGESEKQRQAAKEAQAAEFAQQLTVLGQNLGLEREKLQTAADQFAQQMGWDREKVNMDYAWRSQEAVNDRDFQQTMAVLNSQLQQGNLSFQDSLEQANNIRKMQADSAFARGQAGTKLTPEQLAALSPMEQAAYQAGVSGRTYEDYKRDQDAAITLRNTLITQAAEDPATYRRVQQNVANAIAVSGGEVPEALKPLVNPPGGTGTAVTPTVPEKFEDLAKFDPNSSAYKQYISENNIKPVNVSYRNRMGYNDEWTQAPNVGDMVLIDIGGVQTPVKVTYKGHYNTAGTSDQAYIQYQAPDGSYYNMRGNTTVNTGKGDTNKIKG